MNGTRQDTRASTLVLSAKLKDVLELLETKASHTAFGIELERSRKDKLKVFRTSYNAREQFYLLVMEDPKDGEKTQLATVAYKLGLFGITAGDGELLDEMRLEELQRIFSKAGVTLSNEDAPKALASAYDYALEPTRTKLLSLRSFEPHVRWISGGIGLMFLLVTAIWYFGILPLELYETFLIFGGLSLLFEFLPMLTRRKVKDED